jgi:type I restriction enzyme S subunit
MDRMFVYCFFRQSRTRAKLELISNGVAQQNLSPLVTARLPFVLPPRELRAQFDRFTRALLKKSVLLNNANRRFAASRDLLLPRLISGQMSVTTVENELETAA